MEKIAHARKESEWQQKMRLLTEQRMKVRRGEDLGPKPIWPYDSIPPNEIVP